MYLKREKLFRQPLKTTKVGKIKSVRITIHYRFMLRNIN